MTELSIIVINWNTADFLRRCLTAVDHAGQGLDYEVIVVDNASTDGSPTMVRDEFPEARLIESSQNVGFACANNMAIRASTGRYVLLLNSDAFLFTNAAAIMVRFMNEHEEAGIVGANLYYPNGAHQPSHGRLPTIVSEVSSLLGLDKHPLAFPSPGKWKNHIETGMVSGACLMARRTMLDKIGLLDEDFYMYSEEVDLCYRASKAGWKIFHLPYACAVHIGGGSSGTTSARLLMLYKGKLKYFDKHFGLPQQKKLLAAMRLATQIKILCYRGLKTIKKNHKDDLWREVAQGLLGN